MKKVLLVEDDPMLVEIYQKKIEKNGNFEIIKATSGLEALEKAKQEKPDLILLDLVLPEMDGFDVIKKIRENSNLDNVKIVPFSNLSLEDNRKKLKELGADGFISKSEHTPAQLIDEIERILKEEDKKIVQKIDTNSKIKMENFSDKDQKRILMIDDEETFLEVFGNKLVDFGFEVEKTLKGKDGYELLIKKNFGLVIIGVFLSDIEAKNILINFKNNFPKAKTKFVLLYSENDSEKELEEFKQLGISIFIDKDKIDPEEFANKVGKLLK